MEFWWGLEHTWAFSGPVLGAPGIGCVRTFETCDCWVHPGLIIHSEWAVEDRLGCWSSAVWGRLHVPATKAAILVRRHPFSGTQPFSLTLWGTLSSPIAWLTSCKVVWSLQNPQEAHWCSWSDFMRFRGIRKWITVKDVFTRAKIHWKHEWVIFGCFFQTSCFNTSSKGEEVRWLNYYYFFWWLVYSALGN